MTGQFAPLLQEMETEFMAGIIFMLLGFAPALAGFGVSMCAIEKNLPNSPPLWAPVVWNAILCLGVIALTIVGTVSGG